MELLTYQKSDNPAESYQFPKKEPDTHCNGKVHRQERYCQRPTGWGTNHAGSGRCKLHGGCSKYHSGQLRYSDFIPTEILEKYEEFAVESNEDIKSLNDEIALFRAKITNVENTNIELSKVPIINLENYIHARASISYNNKLILNMTELIRRLIETKQKVEEGIKVQTNTDVVMKIVDFFISIVDKTVKDIETKKSIAGELRRLNQTDLGLNRLN